MKKHNRNILIWLDDYFGWDIKGRCLDIFISIDLKKTNENESKHWFLVDWLFMSFDPLIKNKILKEIRLVSRIKNKTERWHDLWLKRHLFRNKLNRI